MGEFDAAPAKYIHTPRRRFRWLKILGSIILAGILAELLFIAWVWPDWEAIRAGKIPESELIKDYKDAKEDNPKLPNLQWTPFTKALPKSITKVFVFAEDSRFYEHGGIDYQAIREAAEYNWKRKKVLLGASTISQQTTKNLFLSLSRNPLRKWHEFLLTNILEAKLKKPEILHAYLNVAEFGPGVYGLEAAARTYFHKSAHALSQSEAIQLAASLPSPKKHNPRSQTRNFQKRTRRIASAMRIVDQYAEDQGDKGLLEEKLQKLRQDLNLEAEKASQIETEELSDPFSETKPTADESEASEVIGLTGEEIDAQPQDPEATETPAEPEATPPPPAEEPAEDPSASEGN